MKRLFEKKGIRICSLLVVFLMVMTLMPAQDVSADERIDGDFLVSGRFYREEENNVYISGTYKTGDKCPLCGIGTLEGFWVDSSFQAYHYLQCSNTNCRGRVEGFCQGDTNGICIRCRHSLSTEHFLINIYREPATCTSVGYATDCYYCTTHCYSYFDKDGNKLNPEDVEVPIDKNNHLYEIMHDEEKHWSECMLCHIKTEEEAHSWEWSTDGEKHWHECTWCYAKKDEAAHSWATEWSTDGESHWHECTVCHAKKDEVAHSWEWSTNWEKHWHECTVCHAKKDEASHDWGDWITVTEPEVGKAGVEQRICKREGCEAIDVQSIPALIGYTASVSADGDWTKGSSDCITITVNRSEDDINCIEYYRETLIDGEAAEVTAEKGSTVITISPEILEKLGVGPHTVTVSFDDGTAETTLTVKEAEPAEEEPVTPAPSATPAPTAPPASPETGDSTNMQHWSVLLAGSAACLAAVILSSRRRAKKH